MTWPKHGQTEEPFPRSSLRQDHHFCCFFHFFLLGETLLSLLATLLEHHDVPCKPLPPIIRRHQRLGPCLFPRADPFFALYVAEQCLSRSSGHLLVNVSDSCAAVTNLVFFWASSLTH